MAANYSSIEHQTPFGTGDPYYNSSTTDFISSTPRKRPRRNNWVKIVVPIIVIIVIAGAVLGGVLGTRKSKVKNAASVGSSGAASSAISAKNSIGRFATATDSEFMMPIYVSTVSVSVTLPFILTTHTTCAL